VEFTMTDENQNPPLFDFVDELQGAGKLHAGTSKNERGFMQRAFVPDVDDPTATVTFILFEGRTYAVTGGHVIKIFKTAATGVGNQASLAQIALLDQTSAAAYSITSDLRHSRASFILSASSLAPPRELHPSEFVRT
jgi:hypothetical protein